jgi:hypothetical protein
MNPAIMRLLQESSIRAFDIFFGVPAVVTLFELSYFAYAYKIPFRISVMVLGPLTIIVGGGLWAARMKLRIM